MLYYKRDEINGVKSVFTEGLEFKLEVLVQVKG